MAISPSNRIYPISIFIQVQPQQGNDLAPGNSSQRKALILATRKLRRQCLYAIRHVKKGCKNGARIAKKAKIPILEDSGNEDWSIAERIGSVLTFLACIAVAVTMCWFLEKETTKNPIEEELVGVDISNGPLPAVEVRLENMFTTEFLGKVERTFSIGANQSSDQFNIDIESKIALAYLVGQLIPTKPGLGRTITRFLNSTNSTGNTFVPNSDPSQNAMKYAIKLVKSGTLNCEDVIKRCRIRGVEQNCSEYFTKTLTPRGFGCSFNIIPVLAIERVETVRAAFSEEIPSDDLEYWKELDKDIIDFNSGEWRVMSIHTQKVPGEENGISFSVYNPKGADIHHHFLLSVGNPRDHATTRAAERKFPLGNIHHLNLDVVAEHSSSDIKQWVGKEKRKCLFYDEGDSGNYDGYTFKRCFSTSGTRRRNCLLVSEMSHEKNGSAKLCPPSLVMDKVFQIEEHGYRLQGHTECPKSCNDIQYSFTPKSELLYEDEPEKLDRTDVHVFFSRDEVTVRVKDLKGFTAEQIGIVLGMLGFCNEITLPRVIKLVVVFLVYAAIKLWKQNQQVWIRCRRNASPTALE